MTPELIALLRDTSRSFYLTLRVLPGGVRGPIGLAYLLARATDTIADTEIIPVEQRLTALGQLRSRILGETSKTIDFSELARKQGLPAERLLLERINTALAELDAAPATDRGLIRDVLRVITGGQELDIRRFAEASEKKIIALKTTAELDDYTFRVAGCVGEFWTRMCLGHLFSKTRMEPEVLIANGIRFGKGLQLVNILRDLPKDLRQGRCYVPEEELSKALLKPIDLLEPAHEKKFRPLYDSFLRQAQEHLVAGWNYTNALPWHSVRMRLACAWPILIGADTLKKLGSEPVLDPAVRVKTSRSEVKKIILKSVLFYPFPAAWRGMMG